MIYYTSDLHFGHQNVIKFDNRPFADIDEMDKMISSYENLISAINDYKAILNSDIQVLKKVDQAMLEQNENAKNKVDKNIKVE